MTDTIPPIPVSIVGTATLSPAIIGIVFSSLARDGWLFSLAAGDAPTIPQSAASIAGDFTKELERRGLIDGVSYAASVADEFDKVMALKKSLDDEIVDGAQSDFA